MNPPLANYGIPTLDFEVDILTPRERQLVERVLLPDKNIAHDLNISYYTVLSYFKDIRNKTGLLDKSQIVYFGLKKGLIQ